MNELLKLLGSGNKNILQAIYVLHTFIYLYYYSYFTKASVIRMCFEFECNTQQTLF